MASLGSSLFVVFHHIFVISLSVCVCVCVSVFLICVHNFIRVYFGSMIKYPTYSGQSVPRLSLK